MPEKPIPKGSPFIGIWLLFAIVLGGSLIGGGINIYKILSRQRALADASEAYSNARSIGLALLEFDSEYRAFPNDFSADAVNEWNESTYDLRATTSNSHFRQLIASDITQSEQMFYAKIPGTIKPDGFIAPGEALKKHEVGFSYIFGLSTKDDPTTPLVLTPLIPGTTTFDPKPFNGKAIALHIDNSVRSYKIEKNGHIYRDGYDLLSPKHPVWKGKNPDIRYPDL